MKKPDYMGDRELLLAIAAMKVQFATSEQGAETLPCEVDASYRNADFGDVATQLSLAKCENKYRVEQCYKIDISIRLPGFSVKQILIVGDASEIRTWLDDLSNSDAVQKFLLALYRDLSEL